MGLLNSLNKLILHPHPPPHHSHRKPTMKSFLVCALFLAVLLCSSSSALADGKTDGTVIVGAAPATNLVTEKTITLTQPGPGSGADHHHPDRDPYYDGGEDARGLHRL